jgi:hypothetical protein
MVDRALSEMARLNAGRTHAVAAAFVTLIEASWPEDDALVELRAIGPRTEREGACRTILRALDRAYARYPTAHFWWKDEHSAFIGVCPRLAQAAALTQAEILCLTDDHPRVPWSRQGPLYMRDDRAVLTLGRPKLDIVERQDRVDGTVWLRTSKVPYRSEAGDGTVGGFDTITAVEAQRIQAHARR